MAEVREGEGGGGGLFESGAREPEQDIPAPSPEEVPELLGERTDYPVPFGDDEDGGGPGERGGAPPGSRGRRSP